MKKLRNLNMRQIAVSLVIVAILVLGYFFWRGIGIMGGAEEYPIAWFIFVAAIFGAMVNQTFRKEHKEQMALSAWQIFLYVVWKGVVAIVFALALHMMFISGLVSGDIFPKFVHTTIEQGGAYLDMKEFATEVEPESYRDVAKVLVWSFVAGYSERFVPNLISRTLNSANQD